MCFFFLHDTDKNALFTKQTIPCNTLIDKRKDDFLPRDHTIIGREITGKD